MSSQNETGTPDQRTSTNGPEVVLPPSQTGAMSGLAPTANPRAVEKARPGEGIRSGDQFVRALARGLEVISAFDRDHALLSLSDVARRSGVSRATARRLLYTLVQTGYADFDGKYFSLRPRILNLGYAYLSSLGLTQVAQPYMEELVKEVHESCSASVLDGFDVVYVVRVPTAHRIMSINLSIGTRLPAYATSMGRVLLAGLPAEERETFLARGPFEACTEHTVTDPEELRSILNAVACRGWAIVDQELEMGLRSMAVPVRDSSDKVIAALNVSAHASRVSVDDMRIRMLPTLEACARQISYSLAARG